MENQKFMKAFKPPTQSLSLKNLILVSMALSSYIHSLWQHRVKNELVFLKKH